MLSFNIFFSSLPVSCDDVLQQMLINESDIGLSMKSYVDRGVESEFDVTLSNRFKHITM